MKRVRIDLERLRGALKRGDIQKVADKMGIHNASVSNRLHGLVKFSLDDLNQFAEFLGRDTTDFLIIYDESE